MRFLSVLLPPGLPCSRLKFAVHVMLDDVFRDYAGFSRAAASLERPTTSALPEMVCLARSVQSAAISCQELLQALLDGQVQCVVWL
jgi:hypothetical protein